MTTSNSDIAGTLNLKAKRGDTFVRVFTFTDAVPAPINLSGSTVIMEIRERATGIAGALLLTVSTTTGEIVISGGGNNVVTVTIPAADMNIAAGNHQYELEITTAGGVRTTYLKGSFELVQDLVL